MKIVTVRGTDIGENLPKICIPVMGNDDDSILASAGMAAQSNADLVEWRADAYDNIFCDDKVIALLKELRAVIKELPLLFTFRTKAEGGLMAIEPEDYAHLNTLTAQSGFVDLIDVEMCRDIKAVEQSVDEAHKAGVFVVGSFHDFHKTPQVMEMTKRLKFMETMGADIAKIAVMPRNTMDVLKLLEATVAARESMDIPLITMSMGDMGSISRVCGEYFGSSVTFGTAGISSAPGQFEAAELKQVLDLLHQKAPEHESKKTIFLIGFMGTGKSSIAGELSERTGLFVMEMDAEIEKREGRSIPEIFEKDGEGYFRDVETQLLEEITAKDHEPVLVSCGGGVVLREINREMMKSSGTVVLLTATPETVFERIGGKEGRPNLKNRKTPEQIRELMEDRKDKYEAAAHFCVATDHRSLQEICEDIISRL